MNRTMTINRISLPKGCCANAIARANDIKLFVSPIPVGAARPVSSTSAGPMSAASMPPAPNGSQNTALSIVSWLRPYCNEHNEDEACGCDGDAAGSDSDLRQYPSADDETWHGLRQDPKPCPGMSDHADQE